ncbi:ATP-binding cassette, regulator of translational elongation [Saitoella coloradoensis]
MSPVAIPQASQEVSTIVKDASKKIDVDNVVIDYIQGYLTDLASDDPVDDESYVAALGFAHELLVDAGGDDLLVAALCEKLSEIFEEREKARPVGTGEKGLQRLDEAVQIGAQSKFSAAGNLLAGSVDLDATASRKIESRVDKKKLEKAEKKLKAKLEKRHEGSLVKINYESSKLIDEDQQAYEEFYMQVNPLQMGASKNKSKDIKIDGIDLFFTGKRILSDASLTLAYGRRYGLTGINGVGKSTLLRALSRREIAVPTHITILHVEQEITGDETTAIQSVLDADVWRKYLLAEQDRITAKLAEIDAKVAESKEGVTRAIEKERESLDSDLSEIHVKLAEMDADKAESRAASILAGLGFSPEGQKQATKSFSGGWRMRLALARALFCKPDLLLLDEPSNMLDVPSIAFLANYLRGYPSTVLVVSHDRSFLNEVATDIIHQHSERLDYYKGNFDSFYATKEERHKNQVREYERQMGERKHLQAFIDKFRYNAAKSSEAQSRIKKLEKMPILELPEEEDKVTFKFPDVEGLSPPIIQMANVTFGYNAEKTILKNVDIDVQMDSRIGIIGPNGAGKSTMLKLLIEQLTPLKGMVQRHPRLRLGYFAQHHVDALDLNASPVTFMQKNWPGKQDEEYRRHLGNFGIVGMTGLQPIRTLSGGQKSRVAFACLGLQNPHILVLDEPTNHLDLGGLDALTDALKNFKGGVILVSHDVTFLNSVCTSLWVCQAGTVNKFSGTIKEYQKKVIEDAGESGVVEFH